MTVRGVVAGLAVLLVFAAFGSARAAEGDTRSVAFETAPLASFAIGHPERTRFGAFEWIGGFEVTSPVRDVGGLSGLLIGKGGSRLMSISDDGLMLTAAIRRDAAGRPIGLSDGRLRPMRLVGGRVLRGKSEADSESIDLLDGEGPPRAVISFEGDLPKVLVGAVDADGFPGPLTPVTLPADTRRLRRSKGLESIAALPPGAGIDGSMVIIGERAEYRAATEDPPGWVIGGRRPIRFRLRRIGDYDPTDAKVGPDGRLYVLERLFSIGSGIGARIRRFDLGALREGAVVEGETVFEANLADQIDNMEGLALWRDGAGATRASLISDNNRSFLERTLYLEFKLVE